MSVLRYAALYVVHEKLFTLSETDPLHTAFRGTQRMFSVKYLWEANIA